MTLFPKRSLAQHLVLLPKRTAGCLRRWSLVSLVSQRWSSSSSANNTTTTNDPFHRVWPPTSMLSLGLILPFVKQPPSPTTNHVVASITQLPEVQAVLSSSSKNDAPYGETQEALQRATKVFAQVQTGGDEHLALLALTAEYGQVHGRFGQALEALQTLAALVAEDDNKNAENNAEEENNEVVLPSQRAWDVQVALAKVYWFQGNFDASRAVCHRLLDQPDSDSDNSHAQEPHLRHVNRVQIPGRALGNASDRAQHQRQQHLRKRFPLHVACAQQGLGFNRLLQATTRDEWFSIKDPPRMVVSALERVAARNMPATPLALARYNYGVSQVIWAQRISQLNRNNNNDNDVEALPIDEAMRTWNEAMTGLERERDARRRNGTLSRTLQSRLQACMAWGVLHMAQTKGTDDTEYASELAGKALNLCDMLHQEHGVAHVEGLDRVLGLVATCYHKSGQAVTAEGLLQSALDQPVVGPQQALERREVLHTYSRLCHDWEKREGEGEKWAERAKDDAPFVGTTGWSSQTLPMFGGLWFWTPNLFVEALPSPSSPTNIASL